MFSFFRSKSKKVPSLEVRVAEDFDDVIPISEYFHKETGVTFDRQQSILKNKVISFCKQRGIHSFSKLLTDIKIDQQLKQELIDHLTTNETFFYREVQQIKDLVELVKKTPTNVSILCAPSATGEEPYSIAIMLLEAGVSASKFSIVGIDINSDAVSKAQIAVYAQRNIRNLSESVLKKYFTKDGEKYLLDNSVKSLVSFRVINIFDQEFKNLGKFDFIFSRNMLIYFDKETKQRAKKLLEGMRKTEEHEVFFGHADLF